MPMHPELADAARSSRGGDGLSPGPSCRVLRRLQNAGAKGVEDATTSTPRPPGRSALLPRRTATYLRTLHIHAPLRAILFLETERKERRRAGELLPALLLRRASSRFIGRTAATALGDRAKKGLGDPGEFPHVDPVATPVPVPAAACVYASISVCIVSCLAPLSPFSRAFGLTASLKALLRGLGGGAGRSRDAVRGAEETGRRPESWRSVRLPSGRDLAASVRRDASPASGSAVLRPHRASRSLCRPARRRVTPCGRRA